MARPSAVETRQIVISVGNGTPIPESSSPQPIHRADRRTSGVPDLAGVSVVRRPVARATASIVAYTLYLATELLAARPRIVV